MMGTISHSDGSILIEMKTWKKLTAGILLAMWLATCLQGAIITSVSGSNGADAYINQGKSGFNYGSVDYLNVGTADNNKIRNAYLRFDLNTIGFDPANTGFVSLKIFAAIPEDVRPDNVIGLFAIPDGTTGDGLSDWSESTLTYDNAPVIINSTNNGSPLATATIPAPNAGTKNKPRFAFDAGYTFTFESTALANFFKTDTNGIVTLILQYSSGGLDFHFPVVFRENTNAAYRPRLEITADPSTVPEPGTFGLLAGIGALLFVGRRKLRRK
jgi:hypothetical protein